MEIEGNGSEAAQSPVTTPWWAWAGGIFLGLIAMSMLTRGAVLAAIILGYASATCFAPTWRWLERHGKRKASVGWRRFMTSCAALTGLLVGAMTVSSVSGPAPVASVAENASPAAPAQSAADLAAQEKKNQAKIAELLEGERTIPDTMPETKLIFWKDITALAPGNKEYAAKRKALEEKVSELAYYVEHPEEGAELTDVKWRKVAWGMVMTADFTIYNRSLSNLKDFVISCDSKGPSGTTIDRNERVLYDVVESRKSRRFKGFNMGFIARQATTTSCVILRSNIG